MKKIKIWALVAAMLIGALSGCAANDGSIKVQEDVVTDQVEVVGEETEIEAEEESIPEEKDKTVEAVLALDTYGDEFIPELMNELPDNSTIPDIYVALTQRYMAVEAYEDALFVLEVGAAITGEEMLLGIRQEMGTAVGLLEEETAPSAENVDSIEAEKVAKPEVAAGQYTFTGENGTYLLTYDPEKIEIKRGSAMPLEAIGDLRAGVDFSVETGYASVQEYIDEYVAFLKEIDEQEEIERYRVEKIPWRRKWQPTPVFLAGKSHGERSLVGYSSRGCKESDTT